MGNHKRSPCIDRRNVSRRLQKHLIAHRSSLRVIIMHVVVSALAFHPLRDLSIDASVVGGLIIGIGVPVSRKDFGYWPSSKARLRHFSASAGSGLMPCTP